METQKVIFLSPVGFFKGGAEKSLFDLIANPNVEPIIVVPEEGEILNKAKELKLEHYVLPFGSINNIHRPFSFVKGLTAINDLIKASLELKRISKKTGAKIVHSNGLKAHMINCVSRRLGGAKAVLHIRDIPYTSAEKKVWRIMRFLCDAMILVSHACWPEDNLPKKVTVIHNGTPLINETRDNVAHKTHENLTCGFIGRIHPAKGLHLLIAWLSAAKGHNIAANLTVRGTFSDHDAAYEDDITTLIKTLDLKDQIEFTGFIDDTEALYHGVDIVVVPSHVPDPLPRSVMESMARGIPVLGYPAGGIFEMIEDGTTGFLVKDADQFVSALQEIKQNPDKLKDMVDAAKEKIEQEFTLENLHSSVSELYQTL